MSDRASTEKKFNKLLEKIRSTVLPELYENWEELSQEEQTIASTVNFLNIRTPKIFVVITLKVEQDGVSLE